MDEVILPTPNKEDVEIFNAGACAIEVALDPRYKLLIPPFNKVVFRPIVEPM